MAVCVCVCSVVSDSAPEQWSMGVCVCVLSGVQLFVVEQWHMGVYVYVCVCMFNRD